MFPELKKKLDLAKKLSNNFTAIDQNNDLKESITLANTWFSTITEMAEDVQLKQTKNYLYYNISTFNKILNEIININQMIQHYSDTDSLRSKDMTWEQLCDTQIEKISCIKDTIAHFKKDFETVINDLKLNISIDELIKTIDNINKILNFLKSTNPPSIGTNWIKFESQNTPALQNEYDILVTSFVQWIRSFCDSYILCMELSGFKIDTLKGHINQKISKLYQAFHYYKDVFFEELIKGRPKYTQQQLDVKNTINKINANPTDEQSGLKDLAWLELSTTVVGNDANYNRSKTTALNDNMNKNFPILMYFYNNYGRSKAKLKTWLEELAYLKNKLNNPKKTHRRIHNNKLTQEQKEENKTIKAENKQDIKNAVEFLRNLTNQAYTFLKDAKAQSEFNNIIKMNNSSSNDCFESLFTDDLSDDDLPNKTSVINIINYFNQKITLIDNTVKQYLD